MGRGVCPAPTDGSEFYGFWERLPFSRCAESCRPGAVAPSSRFYLSLPRSLGVGFPKISCRSGTKMGVASYQRSPPLVPRESRLGPRSPDDLTAKARFSNEARVGLVSAASYMDLGRSCA